MTILLPHIASRLFGEPLLVDTRKLAAIMSGGVGARVVGGGLILPDVTPVDHTAFARGRPSHALGIVGDPLSRAVDMAERRGVPVLQRFGSVAVIPIEGTLVQKGKWLGQNSGETSYEGIRAMVSRARQDATVKGVVLEVDSFGGEVAGAFETAQAIAGLSREKPTLAILTDFAFSAGYLMAAPTRQIVMPEGGGAGSIGVVAMHLDLSKQLEQRGVNVSLIYAGERKVDGNPALPLADDVRSEMQTRVEAIYERFLSAVGAYRGPRLSASAARATQARTYMGHAAVSNGLVDGIVDPEEALRAFQKTVET